MTDNERKAWQSAAARALLAYNATFFKTPWIALNAMLATTVHLIEAVLHRYIARAQGRGEDDAPQRIVEDYSELGEKVATAWRGEGGEVN